MRIVSTGYHATNSFTEPAAWLERISFYTGILEALAMRDEVHSIEHINAQAQLEMKGVHYHFRRLSGIARRFPLQEQRFIRQLRPDAILVNGFSSPLQVLQLRAFAGSRPKILLWHRADRPRTGWRGALQSLADRCVDAYLFTSPGNAAPWLQSGLIADPDKAHYLMQASSTFNPGDQQEARRALHLPQGPLLLWVGRLDANKDPLTVLEAFTRLRAERPDVRLYMIGPGGPLEAEVRHRIEANSLLRGSVILLDALLHAQLENWYRAADIFVSASHYEGSGIALCEALSCGCIPVHTKIPSLEHLAGPLGFSFSPGKPDELYHAFQQALMADKASLRNAVIQRFQDQFSFEAIASGLRSLIGTL
jgi:glycosyltransferase involved in cell wall biosynthesis